MTTAETLNHMQELLKERDKLLRDIARISDQSTSIGSLGDGLPRGTPTSYMVENCATTLADYKKDLERIDGGLAYHRGNVEREIGRVTDKSMRDVLRMRYVEWKTMPQIAAALNYNNRYIYDKLKDAQSLLYS